MTVRCAVSCAGFFLAAVIFSAAQDQKPAIKHAPAAQTSPASGKEMFMSYCAACHGKNAKGDGPAAAGLNKTPADLTALAKSNGGKYPALRVTSVLRGEATVAAHGTQEMPVWGPLFWKMSQGREGVVQQRIANLNHYIESLQEK
ncbi:MAG: cytochrome c [Acidobacteriia bacterium]|nr:cytochrome c [Terriglobia bacterium]